MVLDIPVTVIFDYCGHDGSDIIFDGVLDPHGRRSFHIQEMIDFCYYRQKAVIPIERTPSGINTFGMIHYLPVCTERIHLFLRREVGVLTGTVRNNPHAVAWDRHRILDLDGSIYDVGSFNIDTLFLIKSI